MGEEQRYFGYVCPACGRGVLEGRSAFALNASAAVIPCACGKSELRVETDGQRFRFFVPCGICGKTHRAECGAEALLHGNGVALACPDCKQLCCFAGEEGQVERALRQLEILAQKEKHREESETPEAFLDSVIMYEVLSELKEIAARPEGITCACGAKGCRMEIHDACVDLVCGACGAKLRIPAATDEDLDRLCCHLKLTIPGGRRCVAGDEKGKEI